MKVTLEFSGGAELLVGKTKKHNVELPEKNEWTLEGLLAWEGCFIYFFSSGIIFILPTQGEGQFAARQARVIHERQHGESSSPLAPIHMKYRCALEFWCL